MTLGDRLGERLDAALGEGPPETALRVQRANVLAAIRRGRRPSRQPRWELAIGLAAVTAVFATIALWPSSPAPLSASWRNGVALGAAADVAAGERSESIEFSDGSRVTLEPKARARVVRLDPRRAEMSLNGGKLVASVRHRDGVSWSIMAGPYEVRVVGTKFSVEWDRPSQTLNVAVTEGLVRVSGGDLGARAVELAPGQHLERRTAPSSAPPALVAPAPTTPAPAAAPAASAEPAAVAPAPSGSGRTSPPALPTVGELAQAGKYRDALALAEQHGFERVIADLPEGELLALGNAARYAGSAGRARQAMLALRDRFPGRPASELGALYLAKIAEQLDRNPKEAARWLRVFLSESPTGSLAADARASLLSILLSSGETAEATAVARDYLKHHPNGKVADRARALVSRSEGK